MDVDVHLLRRHINQHYRQGVAAHGEQGVVCLDDGIGEARVLYPPPVDKERDSAAVGAVQRRRADQTAHLADHVVARRVCDL